MELRDYARILVRFWWLIVALPVFVGVASLVMRPATAPVYRRACVLRLASTRSRTEKANGYDPILTSYQASEYIRDDFVEIIQSDVFADDVNAVASKRARMKSTFAKVRFSAAIEKQRRLMSMSITWNDADQAKKIAKRRSKI